MSKGKQNTTDLTMEERIKKAEKKLKPFFAALDEEKKKFLSEPIHQLAVSQVILERLSEEIAKGDVIELFEQGKQKLRRENPALKSYNTTIKSYSALLKQLLDQLPQSEAKAAGEEILSFISAKKRRVNSELHREILLEDRKR